MFDKLRELLGKKNILITKDMDVLTINDDSEEPQENYAIKNYTQKKVEIDMAKEKKPDQENIEEEKEDLVKEKGMVPENSTLAEENRISDCMEKTGKSREECSKLVKGTMKKEGNQTVTQAQDTEDTEEVSICKKNLDMLLEKAERLDTLEAEKKTIEEKYEALAEDLQELRDKIEAKEKAIAEQKRQDLIEQISKETYLPKEDFAEDSMEELEKFKTRFDKLSKKQQPTGDTIEEDFAPIDVADALLAKYRHPMLKGGK